MKNLRTLPKLRDSLSFVYFEHAKIEKNKNAISVFDKEGETHVPVAALGAFMLGPGTSITHEAMKVLADSGCSVLWVGERGVRLYAQGMGETRSATRLLDLLAALDQLMVPVADQIAIIYELKKTGALHAEIVD